MNSKDAHELKLHLGCGEKYLEGYVNIDYPQDQHSVMNVKADEYKDIRTLRYEDDSVDEVRNHHMFEHFHRVESLWLLLEWRRWLKEGGRLMIETPDFHASAFAYVFSVRRRRKFALGRHIFGSQEAHWADHLDFWDASKFRYVLKTVGFEKVSVKRYSNSLAKHFPYIPFLNIIGSLLPEAFYRKYGGNKLPNIVVTARKRAMDIDERKAVEEILEQYVVGKEYDKDMLKAWTHQFEKIKEERGR